MHYIHVICGSRTAGFEIGNHTFCCEFKCMAAPRKKTQNGMRNKTSRLSQTQIGSHGEIFLFVYSIMYRFKYK